MPRFSIRAMMIIVAAAAISMGLMALWPSVVAFVVLICGLLGPVAGALVLGLRDPDRAVQGGAVGGAVGWAVSGGLAAFVLGSELGSSLLVELLLTSLASILAAVLGILAGSIVGLVASLPPPEGQGVSHARPPLRSRRNPSGRNVR